MEAIEARDVTIRLGGKEIVREVSARVAGGQLVGLFGPNGSGKSTLLKGVYRTLRLSGGAVLLNGKAMSEYSGKEVARALGVVTQFNQLNFDFTVEEMVLMGRSPHKGAFDRDTAADYEIVRECLEKVEMQGTEERSFLTLSGGEKQRILLARALAQGTRFLILDEPTNHLDVKYQLETMEILRSLVTKEGRGVMLALHDLKLAFAYCDYVYVLKDGRIVAQGRPEEVITTTLIREVYEVDAGIYRNPVTGILDIAFLPQTLG